MKPLSGLAALVVLVATLAVVPAAQATPASPKKAIWGPITMLDGTSAFPTYQQLGVGIFEMTLAWSQVAPKRPKKATDPNDPAYHWPADVTTAVREGRQSGIRISLEVLTTPRWANGGHAANWVPKRPGDYADFLTAAAKRYPDVGLWMVWGEPSKASNFKPLTPQRLDKGDALTRAQAKAPQYYARMLDASYAALKRVRSTNLVIGGNTFTTGGISPFNWLYYMRLPNGKRPRMDLYGHNPFTSRHPDLSQPPMKAATGWADFSDLDELHTWLGQYGYRNRRGRAPAIFISEWMLPTDHVNFETNYWFDQDVAATWLTDALRIVRATPWIYTLGWLGLYDDLPRPKGDENNRGLLDIHGNKKLTYFAYRDG